jgi:plastocyanin
MRLRQAWLSLVVFAALATPAHALPGARVSATKILTPAQYAGVQHLHFEFGPVTINPGQNLIDLQRNDAKPDVPGYITRFSPGLVYAKDHTTPRVDVIHLHHGVWLINGYPTFAAGEEKTNTDFPQGYGMHSNPQDVWVMNHMIHNLTPTPTSVYITYDIDFVPDTAPAAAGITPVHPHWMDVAGIQAYPVFDAVRGTGHKGRYTFPDDAQGTELAKVGAAQKWTVPADITLVGTAGHLHPGGLHNDLYATRGDRKVDVFRSQAKYFEPAGAVSWDVAMTASKPDWRVALHAGDELSTTVTYDVARASWYESMGIMIVWYADGIRPEAPDPFSASVDRTGLITHGHLRENRHHGGETLGLGNPLDVLSGARTPNVFIEGFVYQRGDLASPGKAGRLPVVRAGQQLKFTNLDAPQGTGPHEAIYHTITACRAPCNKRAGIAYPLANAAPGQAFDSGELGYGPPGLTPAAQRDTWETPSTLSAGTYTYFCRIHPFMRGAFRVTGGRPRAGTSG